MNDIFIHPTAIVSRESLIGSGTSIWVNSQVREDASIGTNCKIGKDTFIDHNVYIGNGVKIQNGVSVYYGVTIEDIVFIGPNVTFTNDLYPRAFVQDWKINKTIVRKGASIGANSTIICGNELGKYCMVAAGSVVTKDVPDYALVMGNPARIVGFVCKCGKKLINKKCPKCGFELE
ncbi:acyltransferase [Clostridiaceae bacterium M8S5]|nr:acyltransferase [Clostridiaceae bacterium M8S5]